MKKFIIVVFFMFLLQSCRDMVIDTDTYNVCCLVIYLDTLNPETHEIEFEYSIKKNIYCENDPNNLIVKRIVDETDCN